VSQSSFIGRLNTAASVVSSRRALHWRLAIYGLLIITPLLLAGILTSASYVQNAKNTLRSQADRLDADTTNLVDKELERYVIALQVLSLSTNLAEKRFEALYLQAKDVSRTLGEAEIDLRDAEGQTIFSTTSPWGSVVAETVDRAQRAVDLKAVENNNITISDLLSAGEEKFARIALVKPAASGDHTPYFLSVSISSDRISQILRSRTESPSWLMGVTGNDDRIIARNWEEKRYVGQKSSAKFSLHTQNKSGVFYSTTRDGIPTYNVYRRSTLAGWRVAVGVPMAIFQAPYYHAIIMFGLAFTAALTASILLSASFARWLAGTG